MLCTLSHWFLKYGSLFFQNDLPKICMLCLLSSIIVAILDQRGCVHIFSLLSIPCLQEIKVVFWCCYGITHKHHNLCINNTCMICHNFSHISCCCLTTLHLFNNKDISWCFFLKNILFENIIIDDIKFFCMYINKNFLLWKLCLKCLFLCLKHFKFSCWYCHV